MKDNNRAIAVVAVLAAIAAIVGGIYISPLGPKTAEAFGDCSGLMQMEQEAKAGARDAADAEYLKQEIAACRGENPDKAKEGNGPGPQNPPSPSASSSASPESTNQQPSDERQFEFLANRPPVQKDGVNAFGPHDALSPGLEGRSMESLTRDEALREEVYRRYVDPMLASVHESDLGLASGADVDARTKRYSEDFNAWNAANDRITAKLKTATSIEIVELPAGVYDTNFSIPGEVPSVRRDGAFNRPEAFKVLKVTFADGRVVQWRLYCGFQNFSQQPLPEYKEMPQPSPGMVRGPNGTPQVPPGTGNGCTQNCNPSSPPSSTTSSPPPSTTSSPPPSSTTSSPPPSTTTLDTKVPSEGSGPSGNGGEGAGENEDPGPGASAPHTPVPNTPRPNPPAPVPDAGAPTGSTPEPSSSAPPPPAAGGTGETPNSSDGGGF